MNRHSRSIGRLYRVSAIGLLAVCLLLWGRGAPVQAVVDLAYFQATGSDNDVAIEWGTGSEQRTYGFNLHRAETEDFGLAIKLNEVMIDAKQFGQPVGDDYAFVDGDVETGVSYYYWLEVLDTDRNKVFGPEWARPGPPPTSTPISTVTGTSVPTATSTSAPTRTARPTSASVPTFTPSFTATGVPTSTPTGTPTTTPVLPPPSSPSPTSVVEQRLSPTVTPGGMAQATLTPGAAATEWMPTAAPTTVVVASETPTATTVAWGGDSEPQATGWSSFLFRWSTIQPSTILLLVSLMSLLGALLLSVALALVRKLSL